MLNGFWKLTWVETKVFAREPMGVVSSLIIPVVIFVLLGRSMSFGGPEATPAGQTTFNLPIFAGLIIAISAATSLVAIISIYREGGILKRLRATPLSPVTILSAHVAVKLGSTVVSLGLLVLAGRQFFPGAMDVNLASFTAALLLSTLSILSVGFVIASLVPTARFAQPISAGLLYPMFAVSGLFFPVEQLPSSLQVVAYGLPTTHAVTLIHAGDLGWLRLGCTLGERGGVDLGIRSFYWTLDEGVSVGMIHRSPPKHLSEVRPTATPLPLLPYRYSRTATPVR